MLDVCVRVHGAPRGPGIICGLQERRAAGKTAHVADESAPFAYARLRFPESPDVAGERAPDEFPDPGQRIQGIRKTIDLMTALAVVRDLHVGQSVIEVQ